MLIKQKIQLTAFNLFLKYGIKSISMDDICQKLSISKRTLYSFVSNKEELIKKLVLEHLSQEKIAIEKIILQSENAIDEMINLNTHMIKFLSSVAPTLIFDLKKYHPQIWEIIQDRHMNFVEQVILNNLHKGQKQGLYREDLNSEIISKIYIISSAELLLVDWEIINSSQSLVSREFLMYHLNSIVNETGRQKLLDNIKQ